MYILVCVWVCVGVCICVLYRLPTKPTNYIYIRNSLVHWVIFLIQKIII